MAQSPSLEPSPAAASSPPPQPLGLDAGADTEAIAHGHGGHGGDGTRFEAWLVVLVGLAMVALPTLGAVYRRLTGNSIAFTLNYTQHLTLWIGFLGAALATARGQHLALSTVEMLPEGRTRDLAKSFGAMLSALICGVLTYASVVVVLAGRGSNQRLEGGVPTVLFEVVVPIGFAMMAWRFAHGAPLKGARVAGLLLAALSLPFLVSALASSYAGHPVGLAAPDLSVVLAGKTGLFATLGGLFLLAGFLLGAPVFAMMAGLALLLFSLAGTPVASVPQETSRLVGSPTLPAIPEDLP